MILGIVGPLLSQQNRSVMGVFSFERAKHHRAALTGLTTKAATSAFASLPSAVIIAAKGERCNGASVQLCCS
ncbi:MAG: hypothetical protein ABFC96_00310 [Thermoguttaceae bacterium]